MHQIPYIYPIFCVSYDSEPIYPGEAGTYYDSVRNTSSPRTGSGWDSSPSRSRGVAESRDTIAIQQPAANMRRAQSKDYIKVCPDAQFWVSVKCQIWLGQGRFQSKSKGSRGEGLGFRVWRASAMGRGGRRTPGGGGRPASCQSRCGTLEVRRHPS